jgi:CheY-like chemotaxis protein
MKPTLAMLKGITQVLLADESSYLEIRNACVRLLDLFYQVSEFDDTDPVNGQHMQSRAGQAISPEAAAVCIRDMMRTRVFMRGLQEAIATKLQSNPQKAVTVLYAGTGPFATLLIPLVTLFSTTQLKMLLLDINPVSIAYLNRIIRYFNLEPYILQVVETDAVTYRIPAQWQPDIILSETMMPSLKTEPQVSIVANLVGQCPQPQLIPEMIGISAVLYNSKRSDEKKFIHLETLLSFTKDTALKMAADQQKGDLVFPVTRVLVEASPPPSFSRLALLTDIKVFNNHTLNVDSSSLTIPEFVYNLHAIKTWPAVFTLQYRIFPVPGFIVCKEEDNPAC